MQIPNLLHTIAQISTPDQKRFTNLPTTAANAGAIQTIMTIVFTITGAVAVIIVVIGGIKYSTSQGDPQAVSKAKGTIIYAVVGLVISIFAVGIIQFAAGHI
jgi:hypothetical protein